MGFYSNTAVLAYIGTQHKHYYETRFRRRFVWVCRNEKFRVHGGVLGIVHTLRIVIITTRFDSEVEIIGREFRITLRKLTTRVVRRVSVGTKTRYPTERAAERSTGVQLKPASVRTQLFWSHIAGEDPAERPAGADDARRTLTDQGGLRFSRTEFEWKRTLFVSLDSSLSFGVSSITAAAASERASWYRIFDGSTLGAHDPFGISREIPPGKRAPRGCSTARDGSPPRSVSYEPPSRVDPHAGPRTGRGDARVSLRASSPSPRSTYREVTGTTTHLTRYTEIKITNPFTDRSVYRFPSRSIPCAPRTTVIHTRHGRAACDSHTDVLMRIMSRAEDGSTLPVYSSEESNNTVQARFRRTRRCLWRLRQH